MPMGGMLAAGAGGAIINGVFGYMGDREQANAAEEAARQNAEMMEKARVEAANAATTANSQLYNAAPGARDNMEQGYLAGMDFGTQGYGQQREDVLNGSGLASGAITGGVGQQLDSLGNGATQGIGYLGESANKATGILDNRQDRAGAMLDQSGGLYGGFETSPGYDFRRQEGEDALRRQQAASGGRFGGAAGKALLDYNQNFASNEYDKFANRAQGEFGALSSSDAQDNAAGSQAAGIVANTGSQAAGIATNVGRDQASAYGGGASQLADIFQNTGTQLGANAATAGATLGGAAQDYYNQQANFDMGLAEKTGNNIIGASGVANSQVPSAMANNNSGVPYAGSGWTNAANAAGQLGQVGVLAAMYPGAPSGGAVRPASYGDYANAADPNFVGPNYI